jgi:hypothetical protein
MEAAEKFDETLEAKINEHLKILYEYCDVQAQYKNIKLCVPFPTEEKDS